MQVRQHAFKIKTLIQMLAWLLLLIVLAFSFLKTKSDDHCKLTVIEGVLPLTCWENKAPIELRGDWEFQWSPLNSSSSHNEHHKIPNNIPVPTRWSDLKGYEIPPKGIGTYSVELQTPQPIQDLAMLPGRGLTDYQIELINSSGEVELLYSNRNDEGVEVIPSDPILLPTIENGDILKLIVRNRSYYSGGTDIAPTIGKVDQIIQHNNIQISVAAILLGGYTFFGLYNLVLWLGYRRDTVFFLLAMCCLTLAARVLDTEDLLPVFWHDAPVAIFAEIGWGTYFSLAFWWPLYFLIRFPTRFFKIWASLYSSTAAIGLLLVFFTPSSVFMEYGITWFRPFNIMATFVLIGMFVLYTCNREKHSLFEPMSGILVTFATCIDIYLYIIDQRPFIDTSNVAFFILIAGQSFTIARGYSASLERQESLSNDLMRLNESLEIQVQSRTEELEISNTKLLNMSLRDELTSLYNRRAFNEMLKKEVSRHSQHQQPICLLVIDIDFFKKVNDDFGHSAGDAVLISVAHALENMARKNDIVARFGGEEFVIILQGSLLKEAMIFANRVREYIKSIETSYESDVLQVSVSIGVAEYNAQLPLKDFFKQADEALYDAKNTGRDRVKGHTFDA